MIGLRTKYHVTKQAREFLFDGYSDPLLDLAAHLPPGLAPVSIPFDKFGWFYTVSLQFNLAMYLGVQFSPKWFLKTDNFIVFIEKRVCRLRWYFQHAKWF